MIKQKNRTIEIDGSFGEGGGQILRTALSLAALTGNVVHFTRIRAGRKKPGLMRQHLACAKAVAEISGGHLKSADLNSQEMIFSPGRIQASNYRFPVGSAGGGKLSLDIRPTAEWKPFEMWERGAEKKARIVSLSHGIPGRIREDELRICREKLIRKEGWEEVSLEVDSPGPGNAMYAELEFEHIMELFSLCGEMGLSRKIVGERVAGMVNGYMRK